MACLSCCQLLYPINTYYRIISTRDSIIIIEDSQPAYNMLQSSSPELKFWNKKLSTSTSPSEILITAPNILDNYFNNSQRCRNNVGYLPIPIQFNSINQHQSLEFILSKKLRGVKLSSHSQNILKNEIYFVNKSTQQKQQVSIDELFNYYLAYRGEEVTKARNNDTLSLTIIKPFMRIYTSFATQEYAIKKKGNKMQEELKRLFGEILGQDPMKADQNSIPQQQRLQKYYTEIKFKQNKRIIEQADKVLRNIEQHADLQLKQDEQAQKTLRDIKNSNKPASTLAVSMKKLKTEKNLLVTSRINTGLKSMKGTNKKIKFKQLNQNPKDGGFDTEDSIDLCQELALLIQDTQRILRPHMENSY